MEIQSLNLSKNFSREEKELKLIGIDSWESIMNIEDSLIIDLVKNRYCSSKNLNRIKCIALFICKIKEESLELQIE